MNGVETVVKLRVRQIVAGCVLAWGAGAAAFGARPEPANGAPNPWAATIGSAERDGSAMASLRDALAPAADPATKLEVLRAIAASDAPPAGLMAPVAGVLQQPVDADTLMAALRAMGGFRKREAVGEVLKFAGKAQDMFKRPELNEQALRTLARQTGRVDPSGDVASWSRWFESATKLSDASWSELLASFHAARSRSAEMRCAELEERAASVYRRLLVSLVDKDRSPVIAEMILSPAPAVRIAGMDQATRAVLNAAELEPEVAAAAIMRMRDADQSVRTEAAALLEKLEDPRISEATAEALAKESSPVPAAAMLRVLASHPWPGALRDIAAWLDSVGPAFEPAVDAALALDRMGALTDQDMERRIKEVLSSLPASRHTRGTVALLARVGGVREVADLIDSGSESVALAAAEASVDSPELLDRVVAAARRSPALVEPAVKMLQKHRATDAGFAVAESLIAPEPEGESTALAAFAAELPPVELLAVCRRQTDLRLRERYAGVAGTAAYFAQGAGEPRQELAALLARTRLQLKNPGAALAGIEAACPAVPGVGPAQTDGVSSECDRWAAPLRVTALAWLGQVDEAAAETQRAGVPAEALLDALESAQGQPHAAKIESVIRELFSNKLNEQQASRLAALRPNAPAKGPTPPAQGP